MFLSFSSEFMIYNRKGISFIIFSGDNRLQTNLEKEKETPQLLNLKRIRRAKQKAQILIYENTSSFF